MSLLNNAATIATAAGSFSASGFRQGIIAPDERLNGIRLLKVGDICG